MESMTGNHRVQLFKEEDYKGGMVPDGKCSDEDEASPVQDNQTAVGLRVVTNSRNEQRMELTSRTDGVESPGADAFQQHQILIRGNSYHGVGASFAPQLEPQIHFSSPGLLVHGQGQSSPLISGKQFSRDAFLQTGRFDNDINMLLREAELESDFDPRSPGDEDYTDHSQLVREIPEGNSEFDMDETADDTAAETTNQSALSNTHDDSNDYGGDQSSTEENVLLEQALLDQLKISSDRAEGQPEDNTKVTSSKDEAHTVQLSSIQLQSRVDAFIHNSDQLHSLDDSLSSGDTGPEERVVQDLPLALLMYGQPKVWTDEEGNVSNESVQEDEQGLAMTSADLWMQDDMLKTVVPQEKLRPETNRRDIGARSRISDQRDDTLECELECKNREHNIVETPKRSNILPKCTGPLDVSKLSISDLSDQSTHHGDGSSSHFLRSQSDISISNKESDQSQQDGHISSKYNHGNRSPQTLPRNEKKTSPSKTDRQTDSGSQSGQDRQKQPFDQRSLPQTLGTATETSEAQADISEVVNTSELQVQQKVLTKRQPIPKVTQKQVPHSKLPLGRPVSNQSQEVQNVVKRHQPAANQNPPGKPESVATKLPKSSGAMPKNLQVKKRELGAPKVLASKSSDPVQQVQKNVAFYDDQGDPEVLHDISPPERSQKTDLAQERSIPASNATVGTGTGTSGPHRLGNEVAERWPHQEHRHPHGHQLQQLSRQLGQGQGYPPHQGHQRLPGQLVFQGQQLPYQGHPVQQGQVHPNLHEPSTQGQKVTRHSQASIEELLSDAASDVFNMEQVRGHLHNMLKVSGQVLPDKKVYEQIDNQVSFSGYVDDKDDGSSFGSATFQSAASGKSLSELTAEMENLSNFPPGLIMPKVGGGGSGFARRSDATLENQLLRESLEKEVFRRKHCEKQIHLLQNKNLEAQQQLAVAINTDAKKDQMIEQLDKALGKVVDGWKQREAEKVNLIQQLQTEHEQLASQADAQQQLLKKFRVENANLVDQLTAAQQSVEQAERNQETQVAAFNCERLEVLEELELERERVHSLTSEQDQLTRQGDKLRTELHNTKVTLDNERESWEDKEREYLQKIDEITENHLLAVEQERVKCEQLKLALRETQEVLTAAQNQSQQIRIDLDTTTREKESLNVQIGILEAKMESSLRKLEADLRSEAERTMSQKLEEAHRRQRATEEELQDHHRKQVYELSQRHAVELKEQHRHHQDDLRRKDEYITEKALDFEEKLAESQREVQTIQVHVKKLESERVDVTSKLQSMMQAHCNEALRLLNLGPGHSQRFSSMLNTMYAMSPAHLQDSTGVTYSANQQRPNSAASTIQSQTGSEKEGLQDGPSVSQPENSVHTEAWPTYPFSTYSSDHSGHQKAPPTTTSSGHGNQFPEGTVLKNFGGISENPNYGLKPPERGPNQTATFSGGRSENMGQYPGFNVAAFKTVTIDTESNNTQNPSIVSQASADQASFLSDYHSNRVGDHQIHDNYPPTNTTRNMYPFSSESTGKTVSMAAGLATAATSNPLVSIETEGDQQQQQLMQMQVPKRDLGFLERLAREAEGYDRGRFGNSHNSSYFSEEEGCTPLPLDNSTDTINDAGLDSELPAMSMCRLSDMSQFSQLNRLSTGPLLDNHDHGPLLDNHDHGSLLDNHDHGLPSQQLESPKLDYSSMSHHFQQHDDRQQELQKYIKMLLHPSSRSPPGGATLHNATATEHDRSNNSVLRDQKMLTPPENQPPPIEMRGQAHPQRVAFAKTTVAPSGIPMPDFSNANTQSGQTKDIKVPEGGLSPQQVGEISRLLGTYRNKLTTSSADGSTHHNPEMEQLLAYLQPSNPGGTTSQTVQQGGQYQHHPSSNTAHQVAEQPTREAPVSKRIKVTISKEQTVVKIPTETDSPKSSPPRPSKIKPGASKTGSKSGPSGAKHGSAQPERKVAGQAEKKTDPKNKQKGSGKIWK